MEPDSDIRQAPKGIPGSKSQIHCRKGKIQSTHHHTRRTGSIPNLLPDLSSKTQISPLLPPHLCPLDSGSVLTPKEMLYPSPRGVGYSIFRFRFIDLPHSSARCSSSIGSWIRSVAPASSRMSLLRNPQVTARQGSPAFFAVRTSTSESPT